MRKSIRTRRRSPINTNHLDTLAGQAAYIDAGHQIQFPTGAVEVKANWLPANSLTEPFSCDDPPPDFFVEEIDGTCYALVGLHISSKLYPNWLWATFEPQSTVTNPNRCNPQLYGACNDPWGSVPAVSRGAPTQPTRELLNLMTAAKLPTVFHNYRLTGTQIDFTVEQRHGRGPRSGAVLRRRSAAAQPARRWVSIQASASSRVS